MESWAGLVVEDRESEWDATWWERVVGIFGGSRRCGPFGRC